MKTSAVKISYYELLSSMIHKNIIAQFMFGMKLLIRNMAIVT